MKREIRESWIKALRSGEYAKGKGAMRQDSLHGKKYCCLGVLCEILPEVTWNGKLYAYKGGVIETQYLPPGVKALVGMSTSQEIRLAEKNDAANDFETVIADIKRNL